MSRHLRTHVALFLVTALVLVAAIAAACSAQGSDRASEGTAGTGTGGAGAGTGGGAGTGIGGAGTSPSGDGVPSPSAAAGGSVGASPATGAKGAANADWSRVAQALAFMRADVPTKPVVVLLGGSAARESTIDDQSWRDQIVAKGGPPVLAWNMGSRNRTMAQNLAIVKRLPKVPTVIFVGINLGSFTSTQKYASITLPSPAPTLGEVALEQPHQYSTETGILSPGKKKAAVEHWLSQRYPVYQTNFTTNAALLEKIIRTCATVRDENGGRLLRPVLLELPRNSEVIGSALSAPTAKYRVTCKRLAAKYGIKWVPQLAGLPNRDFYDLWHLVEPGRKVWQERLSAKTAYLLELYGFDGGGS